AGHRLLAQGFERADRQDREHARGELPRPSAPGGPVRRRRDHRGAHELPARARGDGRRGSGGVNPAPPRPPSLLRRCALGIWLCGIAVLGAVEFRRYAFAGDGTSMTPVAWMWLAGSAVTGADRKSVAWGKRGSP